MTLKPFGNRLLVKPDPQAKQIGLIHIPDTVNAENPNYFTMTGVVVDKGDGEWNTDLERKQPIEAEIGQRVTYGRYAGKQVLHNGQIHLIMREPEIIAIADGNELVLPGYQAPAWKAATGSPRS